MEQALITAVFYLSHTAMLYGIALVMVLMTVAFIAMLRGLYNYIVRGEF